MWELESFVSIIVSSGFASLFNVILDVEADDHTILGALKPLMEIRFMLKFVTKKIPPQLRLTLSLTTFIYLLFSPIKILLLLFSSLKNS